MVNSCILIWNGWNFAITMDLMKVIHCLRHLLVGREAWEIIPTTCSNFFMILIKRFLNFCMMLYFVFYENVYGLYNGVTCVNLLRLLLVCFIIFVRHFFFFFAGNLYVEVVEEKDKEKWRERERNVNEREREIQKSIFFGFRDRFRR